MSDKEPDNNEMNPEALYADLQKEMPPTELDQKILAHAATRPKQKQTGFRWEVFGRRFAAAAVVVLVVGILLQPEAPIETFETEPAPQAVSSDAVETLSIGTPETTNQEMAGQAYASEEAVAKSSTPAAPKRTRMMLEEREPKLAEMREAPQSSNMIEEIVVADTARQLAVSDAAMPSSLSLEACEASEPCKTKLRHPDCAEAFLIPTKATDVQIEEETLVFTHQEQDHFVRCLERSWTTQSQDVQ